MDFNATLTVPRSHEPDDLVDALATFHPAVGTSQQHPDSWEVVTTLPATSLDQAITTIQAIARDAGITDLRGLEVIPTTDWDLREATTDGELLSVTEAATRLGVTPQAVRERLKTGSLTGFKTGHRWNIPARALRPKTA